MIARVEQNTQVATTDKDAPTTNQMALQPIDQYRSSFWSGAVAALGLRYLPKIFSRNFFETKPGTSYNKQHAYSAVTGSVMMAMTGFYASRTYRDIREVFKEAVGWEMGKPPEDVGFMDLWNSKNSMVQQTMSNYVKFNLRRAGVELAFFVPFIPGVKGFLQRHKLNHGEVGVDLGVASNAAYLLQDVVTRKQTSFESLQALVNAKINHTENYADQFVATDLLNIYERHTRKDKSFLDLRGTQKWEQGLAMFDRMADLMNQNYRNETPREEARFGFSKFVHLLGTGKINPDNIERSRAFVEIVNQYGVKEVDIAARMMDEGKTIDQVMQRYPLAASATKAQEPVPTSGAMTQSPDVKKIIEQKQGLGDFRTRETARVGAPRSNEVF